MNSSFVPRFVRVSVPTFSRELVEWAGKDLLTRTSEAASTYRD